MNLSDFDYPPFPEKESDPELKALAGRIKKFVKNNNIAIILPTADQRPQACREADVAFVWRAPPPPPGAELRMVIHKTRP